MNTLDDPIRHALTLVIDSAPPLGDAPKGHVAILAERPASRRPVWATAAAASVAVAGLFVGVIVANRSTHAPAASPVTPQVTVITPTTTSLSSTSASTANTTPVEFNSADAWSSAMPTLDFSGSPFAASVGKLNDLTFSVKFDGVNMCVLVSGPATSGGSTCATKDSGGGFIDLSADSGATPANDRATVVLSMRAAGVVLQTVDASGATSPCRTISGTVDDRFSIVGCAYDSRNVVGLRLTGVGRDGARGSVTVRTVHPA